LDSAGFIGEFTIVDDHRAGKIVVELCDGRGVPRRWDLSFVPLPDVRDLVAFETQ